jgi:predicted CopG family antitoxin
MSTSIRISESTKEKIDRLKREDETFDELINRLATEEERINFGAWSDDDLERGMECIREHREQTS